MEPAIAIVATNVILYCDRWADTVAFYRDVLGLPVGLANDWFVEVELGDGSALSIADARRATVDAVGGQGITIAWRVEDVHHTRQELTSRGVDVSETTVRFGGDVCYFRDPEGHRIEVWSRRGA